MRINIKNRCRKLETISKGDTLIFPDREETVRNVDELCRMLYTQRLVKITDKNFQIKREFVAYTILKKVFPQSKGHVYDYIKMKENKK